MKIEFNHIHSGVIVSELERQVSSLELEDGEMKTFTYRQSKKAPVMIVKITEEQKKYVTWSLRGARKDPRPVIDMKRAETLKLMETSSVVSATVRVIGDKMVVVTAFITNGEDLKMKKGSKFFQDFWRGHALVKEPDANSPRLGFPWWSMSTEDYEENWRIIKSKDSSPESRREAKRALYGR